MNAFAIASRIKSDLLGPRALNPQPLPPKAVAFEKPDPIGPRALNPQPLPARDPFAVRPRFNAGEFASFEPKAEAKLAFASQTVMSNASRSESLAQIVSRLFGAMFKA